MTYVRCFEWMLVDVCQMLIVSIVLEVVDAEGKRGSTRRELEASSDGMKQVLKHLLSAIKKSFLWCDSEIVR
jgi:hypothetical protein